MLWFYPCMSGETPTVFEVEKSVAIPQRWSATGDGCLQIVLSLETGEGMPREGLAFRGKARADLPNANVLLQLEYPQDGRTDRAIDRIEWRPIQGYHKNVPKGPCGHLHKTFVYGSHRHLFSCNWLTDQRRLLTNNLPIAEALSPDPATFSDLLALTSKCFRINGLAEYVPNPWAEGPEGDLFL